MTFLPFGAALLYCQVASVVLDQEVAFLICSSIVVDHSVCLLLSIMGYGHMQADCHQNCQGNVLVFQGVGSNDDNNASQMGNVQRILQNMACHQNAVHDGGSIRRSGGSHC